MVWRERGAWLSFAVKGETGGAGERGMVSNPSSDTSFAFKEEERGQHLHAFHRRPGHQDVLVVRLHIQLRLPAVHQLQVVDDHQSTC